MRDRKLATRYARALLAALPDLDIADSTESFLRHLAEAMDASAELRDALLNPGVPRTTRKRALKSLAESAGMPAHVSKFLEVVVDHNRVAALPSIARMFREAIEQARGIVPATLTTASPLEADLEARARAALEKLTGRKIRLSLLVDPALIGGAVARVGNAVYDGSLRTQLAVLKRRMAEE
jgi:F-type H+-transporting ATPase subunit delta